MSIVNSTFKDAFIKSIEGKNNLGKYGQQVRDAVRFGAGKKIFDDKIKVSVLTAKKLKAWDQMPTGV